MILICGMHRSGTSCVAEIVRGLGVNLGPTEHMCGPSDENERGFFESLPLSLVNRKLIAESAHEPGDVLAHVRGRLEREATSIIEKFGIEGFKDPRTTIVLPFWLKLFPDAKVILTYRSHRDIAHSLVARTSYHITENAAYALIDRYYAQFWEGYARYRFPLHVVSYPALMLDPAIETLRLAQFLDTDGQNIDYTIVDPSLQHHFLEAPGRWWDTMNFGGVTDDAPNL